jgi:hypothetical protein
LEGEVVSEFRADYANIVSGGVDGSCGAMPQEISFPALAAQEASLAAARPSDADTA